MNRNEWIANRIMEIQKRVSGREQYCEENGIPFYESSECASEEAEEEYNILFGNENNEDEEE